MVLPTVLSAEPGEEPLDEFSCGEVADTTAGVDRGVAERDEQVGLAGAGWTDEHDVLGGVDPLERREVVIGRV
jgi:hypothetical protein